MNLHIIILFFCRFQQSNSFIDDKYFKIIFFFVLLVVLNIVVFIFNVYMFIIKFWSFQKKLNSFQFQTWICGVFSLRRKNEIHNSICNDDDNFDLELTFSKKILFKYYHSCHTMRNCHHHLMELKAKKNLVKLYVYEIFFKIFILVNKLIDKLETLNLVISIIDWSSFN